MLATVMVHEDNLFIKLNESLSNILVLKPITYKKGFHKGERLNNLDEVVTAFYMYPRNFQPHQVGNADDQLLIIVTYLVRYLANANPQVWIRVWVMFKRSIRPQMSLRYRA